MGVDSIASTVIIANSSETKVESSHHILFEECETGKVIGRKDVGENYLQAGREYLQSNLKDIEKYKFVVLHFTEEDYHTRILARKSFTIDGAKCQEVVYRASIYKVKKNIDKSGGQKKDRGCSLGSFFSIFNRFNRSAIQKSSDDIEEQHTGYYPGQ